jgi:hypothetical protein
MVHIAFPKYLNVLGNGNELNNKCILDWKLSNLLIHTEFLNSAVILAFEDKAPWKLILRSYSPNGLD